MSEKQDRANAAEAKAEAHQHDIDVKHQHEAEARKAAHDRQVAETAARHEPLAPSHAAPEARHEAFTKAARDKSTASTAQEPFRFGAKGKRLKAPPSDMLFDVGGDHNRKGTKCYVQAYVQPTPADDEAGVCKCVSEDGKCSFDASPDQLKQSKVQRPTPHTPPTVTGPR